MLPGLLLCLGLLLGGPASAEPAAASAGGTASADETDTTWYAVPNVAYDSDDGLGFGVRFEHAHLQPGLSPYRRAWTVHLFASLRGYHHHRVRYDRLGLGRDGRLRFTAHLAWRQWSNDGYWGIGNGTVREAPAPEDAAGDAAGDPAGDPDKRYRYRLIQPFAHLALRRQLHSEGPWYVYGALNPKLSRVETYAGSLLEEQQPTGMSGGFTPQVLVGLQHDTRQPEVAPLRGHVFEAGGRYAPDLDGVQGPWQAGGFAGVLGSLRLYRSLGSERLVLAARVMGEVLWGQVPFYEMVHWGGLTPVQGVGGFETLRGVRFGRWRAPGKAVANLELRTRPWQGAVKDTQLALELTPFADVGAVFLAREQATTRREPAVPLHPAVGLGGRLVMDETFVGRVDLGVAPDPVEQADGTVVSEWTTGIYVVFDHPF